MELEPQILGYETQGRVFGRSYLVARVMSERSALVVFLVGGKGDVEVYSAATLLVVTVRFRTGDVTILGRTRFLPHGVPFLAVGPYPFM